MSNHFADRLADGVRAKGSSLCVGLDPRWTSLPIEFRGPSDRPLQERVAAAFELFCLEVLELVAPYVGCVKPQSAFFESCGPSGMKAQESVLRRARELGLITILDAKRGDIADTAIAYADAALGFLTCEGSTTPVWDADALTVNPYLGRDAIEPFIQVARRGNRGIFVLVRTSNRGAGLFQDLPSGGRNLFEIVGDEVALWAKENIGESGFGDVGAVVGATHPEELASLRRRLPQVWFLVPGYGAQGGSAADVRAAFRDDGLGAIVNSSRGVTFPFQPTDVNWKDQIIEAVRRSAAELSGASWK